MVDRLRARGLGSLVPYLAGAFLLTPFALWGVMWLVAFPGPKYGFDPDVAVALFAVSVPLVIWFFLSALGVIANSVAEYDEFARPRSLGAHRVIGALPAAAIAIGIGAALFLVVGPHPWPIALTPLAMGSLIAAAIVYGERARAFDRRSRASMGGGTEDAAGGTTAGASGGVPRHGSALGSGEGGELPFVGVDGQSARPVGMTTAASSAVASGDVSRNAWPIRRLSVWGMMAVVSALLVGLVWGLEVALIAIGLLGTVGFLALFLVSTLGRGGD